MFFVVYLTFLGFFGFVKKFSSEDVLQGVLLILLRSIIVVYLFGWRVLIIRILVPFI